MDEVQYTVLKVPVEQLLTKSVYHTKKGEWKLDTGVVI